MSLPPRFRLVSALGLVAAMASITAVHPAAAESGQTAPSEITASEVPSPGERTDPRQSMAPENVSMPGSAKEPRGCPPVSRTTGSDEQHVDLEDVLQPVSVEKCDLRGAVVDAGTLSAEIPAEGEAVTAFSLETDGASVQLDVIHRTDGHVTAKILQPEAPDDSDDITEEGGAGTDTACENFLTPAPGSAVLWPPTFGHESHTHKWFFSNVNFPTYLHKNNTIKAARRGSSHWETSNNDCGIPDGSNYSEAYAGTTNLRVNIPRDGGCGTRDGINVVGFGPINNKSTTLARACTWRNVVKEIIEADVKFDTTGHRWWVLPWLDGCSDRWDLEAIMTHERGHTVGYKHVDEHGYFEDWTMSPKMEGECNDWERTLGLHEAQGNNTKY